MKSMDILGSLVIIFVEAYHSQCVCSGTLQDFYKGRNGKRPIKFFKKLSQIVFVLCIPIFMVTKRPLLHEEKNPESNRAFSQKEQSWTISWPSTSMKINLCWFITYSTLHFNKSNNLDLHNKDIRNLITNHILSHQSILQILLSWIGSEIIIYVTCHVSSPKKWTELPILNRGDKLLTPYLASNSPINKEKRDSQTMAAKASTYNKQEWPSLTCALSWCRGSSSGSLWASFSSSFIKCPRNPETY